MLAMFFYSEQFSKELISWAASSSHTTVFGLSLDFHQSGYTARLIV